MSSPNHAYFNNAQSVREGCCMTYKTEYALRQIQKKLSHFAHRVELSHTKAARIPKVAREAFNGNYWRYSGGWRSIAKDLVFR